MLRNVNLRHADLTKSVFPEISLPLGCVFKPFDPPQPPQ
jgi:hypothetical protein